MKFVNELEGREECLTNALLHYHFLLLHLVIALVLC